MRISEDRKSLLYGAIHDSTMDMRCKVAKDKDIREVDNMLFKLNEEIWRKISLVLKIK
jgi:hypothetical protein